MFYPRMREFDLQEFWLLFVICSLFVRYLFVFQVFDALFEFCRRHPSAGVHDIEQVQNTWLMFS